MIDPPPFNTSATPEEHALINKVLERWKTLAENKDIGVMDATGKWLDLVATNANGTPLDFEQLLSFDDEAFWNDVWGIFQNISRDTGKLRRDFSPQCAKVKPLTPLMLQYSRLRAAIPSETILLIRLGDFYEAFESDAERIGSILNIGTTRRNGFPMAGFPYHAREEYFQRIAKAGERVALFETR